MNLLVPQRVLVQVAVAQVMGWQRTAADVIRFGAGPPELGVVAAAEVPVAFELGARGALGKFVIDVLPLHIAVLLHVVIGDPVRDALVA